MSFRMILRSVSFSSEVLLASPIFLMRQTSAPPFMGASFFVQLVCSTGSGRRGSEPQRGGFVVQSAFFIFVVQSIFFIFLFFRYIIFKWIDEMETRRERNKDKETKRKAFQGKARSARSKKRNHESPGSMTGKEKREPRKAERGTRTRETRKKGETPRGSL